MNDPILVGPLLQRFFVEYLNSQKRSSPETIASYRDTFRLLLQFVQEKHRIQPAVLSVEELSCAVILSFLEHLEVSRGNSVRSRNLRLAAIRSFFRLVSFYEPACLIQCTSILSIPTKRTTKPLIRALTQEEIDAILSAPNTSTWAGRRDQALLLTLYNSGARVSEIIALKRQQIVLGKSSVLHLLGKGRKERTVPLWTKTASALRLWCSEIHDWNMDLVFPSSAKRKLTRNGFDYILQRAVTQAGQKCPSLFGKRVTPHVIRHTTATHLLQSGVDLSVIALWLGHESVDTTHIYLESDLTTKQQALDKLSMPDTRIRRFKPSDKVLAFLSTL